jgi:hypothetical protein
MEPIRHDDFKKIWKESRLTPKEWIDLQNKYYDGKRDILYQESQIHVFSCLCRSAWCEHCSKFCDTSETIRERLADMRWDMVRQVVLTVSRETDPGIKMAEIRNNRAIPKLIKALGLGERRWLWVLEFHADGYPHWHLFIENLRGRSGLIGKHRIQKLWKHGHVWESYPKDAKHWGAITGYHRKAGYFAGESKKHQLTLPDYLMDQSRVRKFGSNYQIGPKKVSKKKVDQTALAKVESKPRMQKPYQDRLKACNTTCKIERAGAWCEINAPGSDVRRYAKETLEEIDFKTYQGSTLDTIDFILELPTILDT